MQAEGNLVVLEVASNDICQTGFEEEAEIHYKVDQEAALAPCRTIKHVFERTARDSPDVVFLALEVIFFLTSALPCPFRKFFRPGRMCADSSS